MYYWGRRLSARDRSEGGRRTLRTTAAYEIEGRGSAPVCAGCVLRRRLLLLAWVLPCLGLLFLLRAAPGIAPPQGPLRLAFFLVLAASFFPVWMYGRRAFSRAEPLRDAVAADLARPGLPGRTCFTRARYRRMGGRDRGTP